MGRRDRQKESGAAVRGHRIQRTRHGGGGGGKKKTLRVSSAINTANRAAIVLVSQGERAREKKNMLNKVAGDLLHKKKTLF